MCHEAGKILRLSLGAVRLVHLLGQPGLGIGPVPVCRPRVDTKLRRGLIGRGPRERAELADFRGYRMLGGESLPRLVEGEEISSAAVRSNVHMVQRDASSPAAVLVATL